ncbi:MAG: glycoside hydrolase family 127 protein [Gemmatimonadaceae bacterium]|nr:glycoside hydrolase family 127 protein [Gemmatimonadaceae bacterium]
MTAPPAPLTSAEHSAPRGTAAPIPEALQTLPLGAIAPRGWLREQLRANLDGITGHLDQLVPELVIHDDIYGRDRLSPSVRAKDVGALGVPEADRAQFLWWNSETQSNWWDGFIRTAILLGDDDALTRAAGQVEALLATQDDDGYLGIYAPALRYTLTGENGELWAKATALRYLLAWYEYTQRGEVLDAVRRAVDELMARLPAGASRPFRTDRPDTCGLTHGLMLSDVLERLVQHTGDRRYADYLVFLYRAFSAEPLAEDARLDTLQDDARPLAGHGVHTYAHLRAVAAAYAASGDAALEQALAAYLRKLAPCLSPSGGPIGDEFINGTGANATTRGYETCSVQELLHSYASLFAKQGHAAWGDAMEQLFVNAAQGARHPDGRGIAYLTSDNAYAMTGSRNNDPAHPTQTRYRYSPVHREAAVCCVPNAGRITPTYVQHLWMRRGDTLVATLLGPSTVRTVIADQEIRVAMETEYPHSDTLHLTIEGAIAGLSLQIRRPGWAQRVQTSAVCTDVDGFLCFTIAPSREPVVLHVTLIAELTVHRDAHGAAYFTDGPCVLARALPADEVITRRYALPGFVDRNYTTPDPVRHAFAGPLRATPIADHPRHWSVMLHNPVTQQPEPVRLQPMGTTILRQVTFPPVHPASRP